MESISGPRTNQYLGALQAIEKHPLISMGTTTFHRLLKAEYGTGAELHDTFLGV